MYTRNKLEENIIKKLNKEIDNKVLFSNISKELSKKGLNTRIIPSLLEDTKDVSDLTTIELIAIAKGMHSTFESENFLVDKYFGEEILNEYEDYFEEEKKVNEINLSNVTKIDDFNYLAYVPYKDLYLYYINLLIRYNKKSQRASKLKLIGSEKNIVVREMDINQKSVEDISFSMKKKEYEEDTIILNLRLLNEKSVPQIKFSPKFGNVVGDLRIVPMYDRKSIHYTSIECIDGMHRLLSCVRAVREYKEETGNWLEGGLIVKIVLRDLVGARKVINQVFKRSDTDQSWLDSFSDDDANKFVDELVIKTAILNNIPVTWEEHKAYKSVTYKSLLSLYIRKYSGIDTLNSITTRKFLTDKISVFIKVLAEVYTDQLNESVDFIKNNTILLSPVIFVGYLAICVNLNEHDLLNEDMAFKVAIKMLILKDNEKLKELLVDKKSVSVKSINNYFLDVLKEVLIDE